MAGLASAVEAVGRQRQGRSRAEQEIRSQVETLEQAMLLHFRKEEEGLYPEVQRITAEGAPAVDILSQFFGQQADDDLTAHRLLRGRMREMLGLLEAVRGAREFDSGWSEGLRAVVGAAQDLLTRHARKEDTLVFPMIERLLDDAQMAAAGERMRIIAREGGSGDPGA
jgi:iron-sulfur cluster repair protein YtfE (RIC family)